MTSPNRFGGKGIVKTDDIVTSLTPYPRICHGTHSMGALSEPEDMIVENDDIDNLLDNCEDPSNKFCCLPNNQDDDVLKYDIACNNMGTNYTFRGQFSQKEFSDSIY